MVLPIKDSSTRPNCFRLSSSSNNNSSNNRHSNNKQWFKLASSHRWVIQSSSSLHLLLQLFWGAKNSEVFRASCGPKNLELTLTLQSLMNHSQINPFWTSHDASEAQHSSQIGELCLWIMFRLKTDESPFPIASYSRKRLLAIIFTNSNLIRR